LVACMERYYQCRTWKNEGGKVGGGWALADIDFSINK
jgi:hypothetical protein